MATVVFLSCPMSVRAEDDAKLFVVPDGSFAELRDYATRLREELIKRNKEFSEKRQSNSFTPEDEAAVLRFNKKYDEVRAEVLQKIAALPNPDKEAKVYIVREKWNAARRSLMLPDRVNELQKIMDACENDPDLADIRKEIKAEWFLFAFMNADDPSNLALLYVKFLAFLKEDTDHAVYCCDEFIQKLIELRPKITKEEITPILKPIITILETSQNEQTRSYIDKLAGTVRFCTLPGREMELKGTLPDGTTLDLKDLAGKVVYVDFWDTSCGPCVGEMPELHAKYLALKDVGFEVVSYSIDEEMDNLTAFMKKTGYTWPTISVLKSKENGLPDYYEYYGGGAIPKTVLIGRDGKVIKTDVRGRQLSEELDKLFAGEIEKKLDDPNVPFSFKLDYHLSQRIKLFSRDISENDCEKLIHFIIENKDEGDRNLVILCQMLMSAVRRKDIIDKAQHREEDAQYRSAAVAKRLLPHLQGSKSAWLCEYAGTLEGIVRSSEMFGKEMEFEAIRNDGSSVNLKDFRGKPVVIAMYWFHSGNPADYQNSGLPFMLNQLRQFETKYAAQGLQVIAYYVGNQKGFPKPDESMKNWIITDGEASIAKGMKNYWQYYGAIGSPQLFLIDRDGLAIKTDTDFGKSLERFFAK